MSLLHVEPITLQLTDVLCRKRAKTHPRNIVVLESHYLAVHRRLVSQACIRQHQRRSRSNCVPHEAFDSPRAEYTTDAVGKVLPEEEVDKAYMHTALEEARQGAARGEVPVGAVLIHDGKVLARAHNLVERSRDPTAHAEMLVIQQAAAQGLGRWDLQEATLYVTLEPCAMCAGAILISRVGTVVYGATSTLLGADGTWMQLFPCHHDDKSPEGSGASALAANPHPTHPNLQVRRGVLAAESGTLMRDFFRARRKEDGRRPMEAGSVWPAEDLLAIDFGKAETEGAAAGS